MKTKLILTLVTALALGVAGLGVSGCKKSEHEHSAAKKYTCPHHPEVVQDKPGKCPKCSMDLVEKK